MSSYASLLAEPTVGPFSDLLSCGLLLATLLVTLSNGYVVVRRRAVCWGLVTLVATFGWIELAVSNLHYLLLLGVVLLSTAVGYRRNCNLHKYEEGGSCPAHVVARNNMADGALAGILGGWTATVFFGGGLSYLSLFLGPVVWPVAYLAARYGALGPAGGNDFGDRVFVATSGLIGVGCLHFVIRRLAYLALYLCIVS